MSSFDINRKRVIRCILELEEQSLPLLEESASQDHKVLFEEAVELFGTWALALEYAGVRVSRKASNKLPPKFIIQQIRGRVGRLNCVRAMHIRKVNHKLYRAGVETFGSWHFALEAAGVDAKRMYFGRNNPRLNNEQIFELLRERAREGKSMRLIDFACDNLAVARTVESRFRNWKTALTLAGLIKTEKIDQHS
jgi:hypothetical protein